MKNLAGLIFHNTCRQRAGNCTQCYSHSTLLHFQRESGGCRLVRAPLVHIMLAIVILVQSVSTLAYMEPVPDLKAVSGEITSTERSPQREKARKDSMTNCHESQGAIEEVATASCCDTMDTASCILSCASVAAALPILPLLDSIDIHAGYPADAGYAAPHKVLDRLYRPPRTS